MRIAVGLLACLGAGTLTSAIADPSTDASPTTTASTPAASSPAAAPATAAPATAASSTATASKTSTQPEFTQEEKQLFSEGYRAEIRGNDLVFCRRETALGSHLPGPKVCASAAQLKAAEKEAKEATQHVQTWAPSPPPGK